MIRQIFSLLRTMCASWSWTLPTGYKVPKKDYRKKVVYVWSKSGPILKMYVANGRSGKTQAQLKDEILNYKKEK